MRSTAGDPRPSGPPAGGSDRADGERRGVVVSEGDGLVRVDALLVARGLARSRGRARELVEAGAVRVDGEVVDRSSRRIDARAPVAVDSGEEWVGRGAWKLLAALDAFDVPVRGRRCLDVGASTGGFTQVLLRRGARAVTALDVGHGQLAPAVAADPRVEERSGVNVRDVGPDDLDGPFDVVVADLSFVSLRLVLPVLRGQLVDAGDAVLLVKPQFEVGRERLGKNGLVRSARLRREAVEGVVTAAAEAGLAPRALAPSPVAGGAGNREYLLWCQGGPARGEIPAALRRRVTELDLDLEAPSRDHPSIGADLEEDA